ncbi:hypothetical protein MW887_001129 [Aspergillus wentii]|nr:hypothetical protein MW887_001129 [Aspergillus wentii]
MVAINCRQHAFFETTKRLLAELVNEGLVQATVVDSKADAEQRCLKLKSITTGDNKTITVRLRPGTIIETRLDQTIGVVRPDSLQPPVVLRHDETETEELDPGYIFTFITSWLADEAESTTLEQIALELQNSARNQVKWLEISRNQTEPTLESPSITWERSLYHRLCYAQEPLQPVAPEDIPAMLTPDLTFISIPRTDMHFTGPFEETLQPLLRKLQLPEPSNERAIVPCLTQQLPSITQRFPNAIILKTVKECAEAQVSMRTLTIRPELEFPFHLKMSLACNITSALRTITPWTTRIGPLLSEILEKFLPPGLWMFKELAGMTGCQSDFNEAKHFSCIIRDDMEERANANNEALAVGASLAEINHDTGKSCAERVFGLETVSQKQEWLRSYVTRLFEIALPPLVLHGIGFEAHGQNIVARICRQTGQIKGFVVRDFGGVRLHVPTLESQGICFASLPPGGAVLTDNMENVWSKVHHSLLQNHVGLILTSLGLERNGGWGVVRDALSSVLKPEQGGTRETLYEYFLKDTMPFKCFLRMRMAGKYRDYVEREVPNVLLIDSDRWQSVLQNYQPSIHYT